jgi:hypothetical protein
MSNCGCTKTIAGMAVGTVAGVTFAVAFLLFIGWLLR